MSPTPTTTTPQQKQQQQGRRRRQISRYGAGLQEKQTLKNIFGLREGQLKRYYKHALEFKGQTGPTLISLLERRLDNAIFRAGFAQTRPQARQMATHRLFAINGTAVDVPSHALKPGDVISVLPGKQKKAYFSSFDKRMQNVDSPSWILIDAAKFSFTVQAIPSYEEANIGVDVRAVVEFFAR